MARLPNPARPLTRRTAPAWRPHLRTEPSGPRPDPFGTDDIRERVLQTWQRSPERFREDANSEDDLVHGGYRDRVVVELAQNAADAAQVIDRPGRLLLRLERDPPVLTAANTGAPLSAEGVLALATLRASAKRDGSSSGRFGVGFSAVLALTDEPVIISTSGAVGFSRARSAAEVQAAAESSAGLSAELERRGSAVPVLRLPYPLDAHLPQGYDTAVVMPLRDETAVRLASDLLAAVDDTMLIALPALAEVVIEVDGGERRLLDVEQRWDIVRRSGSHDRANLADRPAEERERPGWQLAWALPRGSAPVQVPGVVYAPTPTDEPLPWPAMLVADLPLDPDRRHVVPGAAATAMINEAAQAYAELARQVATDGGNVWALVPSPSTAGLAAGWLDDALREAVLAALNEARILAVHTRDDSGADLITPREATVLSGAGEDSTELYTALAPHVATLVRAERRHADAVALLAVERVAVSELIDSWPDLGSPEAWIEWYRALAAAVLDSGVREALATLPVPLEGARVSRGARELLLPVGLDAEALTAVAEHGVRLVERTVAADPVARDLLLRMGAVEADPENLVAQPEVRLAVEHSVEDHDEDLAVTVLGLVAACADPGELGARLPWLSRLALPDDEGDLVEAALLVSPGSPMQDLLDPEAVGVLDHDVAARWPEPVLEAVGVAARGPVAVTAEVVGGDDLPETLDDLDAVQEWLDDLGVPPGEIDAEITAVRDLDLVRPDRVGELVRLVAAEPRLHRALLDPVAVSGPDGHRRHPSYLAWWLRREAGAAGTAAAGAEPELAALLPSAPGWTEGLAPEVSGALGTVLRWSDIDARSWPAVLRRASEATDLELAVLVRLWTHAAVAAPARSGAGAPVWALQPDPSGWRAVRTTGDETVVADDQRWAQRRDLGAMLVVPPRLATALAEVFDLDLASERAPGRVTSEGARVTTPQTVMDHLPDVADTWWEHDELRVDQVDVDWWVEEADAGPRVHAATSDGLARALAYAAGAWPARHLVASLLAGGADAVAAMIDDAFVE